MIIIIAVTKKVLERALQNRAFVKFRRYREIEILTYCKYEPVPISLWS